MRKKNSRVGKHVMAWMRFICVVGITLLASACQDDWLDESGIILPVEEGISGELTLQLASSDSESRQVQTRGNEGEHSEQHLHSAYIFVINRPENAKPSECRILSRKYYPDILPFMKEIVGPNNERFDVATLKMPAVSAQRVQIYAIANLGYSDLQGVKNDATLLAQCDTLSTLDALMKLSVELRVSTQDEVNVERMQGHHLMSGFYGSMENRHYLREPEILSLKATPDGHLSVIGPQNKPYRPLGVTGTTAPVSGTPAALFVHRLDVKVTFRVEPIGEFRDTPGAYFRLLSWQVLNAPSKAELYWKSHPGIIFNASVKNSKVFQRDLSQGDDKSWEFTFYQLQNCVCTHGNPAKITAQSIADQYNQEYHLQDFPVTETQVKESFSQGTYPNAFSSFAYTMRELQHKILPQGGAYVPNQGQNNDQTIVVQNGDYVYAPKNASMVRLEGLYYNPNEPARRMKDDPRNETQFKDYPLNQYPYWGVNEKPVATKEEALKRTRSARVVYYVHLGYVGGGNYHLNDSPIPTSLSTFEQFEQKVNDYNVMRNHHYTYTLKVAGVENIKLEATREEQGNILEQEKQPGAEGTILESQHFFDLDSHYETRNVTIDFTRFPLDYTQGFSFTIDTPFEQFRATLKELEPGVFKFVDQNNALLESIRNHDWDWIHFVWHGTTQNPSRSLIDPNTGNGISYSDTHGGYEYQQTYAEKYLTHEKDAEHPYQLLNSLEFSELVWRLFVQWVKEGRNEHQSQVTFTMFVDENYYDFNPVNNAEVNWWDFCNKPQRKALYFMEPEEASADQNSWYADAHLAIYQKSIQTLYATDTKRGQVVADVAFGIEALDEFRAKYATNGYPFGGGNSLNNGLYNIMNWYYGQPGEVISWKEAEGYFTDKCRAIVPDSQGRTENQDGGGNRNQRNPKWAIYSRNRDLNRDKQLNSFEVRWFVPAIDQYTLCFLGGRPVFENPLFERDKAVKPGPGSGTADWIYGVPVLHYISSSKEENNQIFWAEEGCSKGNYGDGKTQHLYGIRMARMLCGHGVDDTGNVFESDRSATTLKQDGIFTVSHTPNGVPVDYNDRVDGKPYYIVINKMNVNAFRDQVYVGDLAQHTHEQKENWLYRSYRIAKNKIGYSSYENKDTYDRTLKVNGIPRTWWQINGVWSDPLIDVPHRDDYYYRDQQHSLAYVYYEDPNGDDLHHWRMPNLREAAIMSIAFPQAWFDNQRITAITKSDNLSAQSTKVPFWKIGQNEISRMGHAPNEPATVVYARPIQDF